MTSLSAVIADDEPLLSSELESILTELWPGLTVAQRCTDGAAALDAITRHQPAVAFLDIRMPKLSGLEVAELVQGMTQVVFVTAYDDHAVAAFEQGAVDYVLKPVKRARLAATINRVRRRLAPEPRDQARAARPRLHWIQATLGDTLRFFPIEEICCFQSDGKYTRLSTPDADALIRRSLKALLPGLDDTTFWQIHRNTVVNVQHIESVVRRDSGEMVVRLRGSDRELPVSRARQALFRGM